MNRKQWRADFVSAREAEAQIRRHEMASRITDLEVCKCFYEAPDGFLDFQSLQQLNPNYVWDAFARAFSARLLVSVALERRNGHGEFDQAIFGFVLTDAGKHLVMTHANGATARALINEIEEEMAGQA